MAKKDQDPPVRRVCPTCRGKGQVIAHYTGGRAVWAPCGYCGGAGTV